MKRKTYDESYEAVIRFHDEGIHLDHRVIYFGMELDYLGEEVNAQSVSGAIKNLIMLNNIKIAPITLILNTVGGGHEDGMALYDVIRSIESKVTILGMGKIYSMGSIILQAAHKRVLTPNSYLLIHQGSMGFEGTPKSFNNWNEWSKETLKAMYNLYYERMKQRNKSITLKEVEEMLNEDTIINAKKAIELGLADSLMEYVN